VVAIVRTGRNFRNLEHQFLMLIKTDMAMIAALTARRLTQGIYRLGADVLEAE
jgi:hypothetical protein